MKLISWNVNSLNARKQLVTMFLDAVAPDVLCIQELKLPDDRVPTDIFTERGYHVAVHGQPRWNGVLIASKAPLADVHKGLPDGDEGQSRLIAATVDGVRIVNLYCPQGQAEDSPKFQYKLRFFDALIDWIDASAAPSDALVVTGDINIAPRAHDIWAPDRFKNVPSFHPLEHARWNRLIEWGLIDALEPRMKPGTYTFWDYRGGAFYRNNGMRIDHFLVTDPINQRVASGKVHRDWRKKKTSPDGEKLTASDHAPVEMVISASA
ncbi:MAG: exodeoxyribonuclease III [Myxococcota bacterium]